MPRVGAEVEIYDRHKVAVNAQDNRGLVHVQGSGQPAQVQERRCALRYQFPVHQRGIFFLRLDFALPGFSSAWDTEPSCNNISVSPCAEAEC